jgi:hypothetical protein
MLCHGLGSSRSRRRGGYETRHGVEGRRAAGGKKARRKEKRRQVSKRAPCLLSAPAICCIYRSYTPLPPPAHPAMELPSSDEPACGPSSSCAGHAPVRSPHPSVRPSVRPRMPPLARIHEPGGRVRRAGAHEAACDVVRSGRARTQRRSKASLVPQPHPGPGRQASLTSRQRTRARQRSDEEALGRMQGRMETVLKSGFGLISDPPTPASRTRRPTRPHPAIATPVARAP